MDREFITIIVSRILNGAKKIFSTCFYAALKKIDLHHNIMSA